MQEGDERFAGYDFTPVIEAAEPRALAGARPGVRDPRRDASSRARRRRPRRSGRSRSLPEQFDNRAVTLTGRFRGAQPVRRSARRGSPRASGTSSCSRPTPRSGSPDSARRARTSISIPAPASTPGRWLEVTGTVQRERPRCLDRRRVDSPHDRAGRRPGRSRAAAHRRRTAADGRSSARRSPDETDFPISGAGPDPVLARHEPADFPRPRATPLRRPERRRRRRRSQSTATYNEETVRLRSSSRTRSTAFQT